MEYLEIVCPDCGTTYEVKPEQAGKLLHCQCGRFLVAASKETHEEVVDDEPVVDLKKSKPTLSSAPPSKVAFREEAEDPEYPKTEQVDYAALIRERQEEQSKRYAEEPEEEEPAPLPPPKVETPKPVAAPPVIPPIEQPVIGVKAEPPKPKVDAPPPPPPPTVFEPKPAAKSSMPMDKQKMMIAGGGGVLVLIILIAVFARGGSKPDAVATPAPASPVSTAPANATQQPVTPATSAPTSGGCGATAARLDNGAKVTRSLLGSGMGRLEIENQTTNDISARLVNDSNLTIAWVYVQQGQTAALPSVPLGSHKLLFETGSDWDADNLTFKCNDVYSEWSRPLTFTERREDERSLYTNLKITLGKAKVVTISKDDFLKGHVGGG